MKENKSKDVGLTVFVDVEKGIEGLEDALRRFKRRLFKFGTLEEVKNRQYYTKPSDAKRLRRKNVEQKIYID